mmetsp:Transcript_19863/g.63772  ORF Transcript_19863/g.63772 Transcript_19863/m.63772 type:complete len:313 (-) Transcript_19863:294-1232(-)
MRLVLLARVVPHHLQRLEHRVVVAREVGDARADGVDRPVAACERRRRRRPPVLGDRADRRAVEVRLGQPQDLCRLRGRHKVVKQPHARRGKHLHHAHLVRRRSDPPAVGLKQPKLRVRRRRQRHGAAPNTRRAARHVHRAGERVCAASVPAPLRRHRPALPRQGARGGALRGQHELVGVLARPSWQPAPLVRARLAARDVDARGEHGASLRPVCGEHAVHVRRGARLQAILRHPRGIAAALPPRGPRGAPARLVGGLAAQRLVADADAPARVGRASAPLLHRAGGVAERRQVLRLAPAKQRPLHTARVAVDL